MVGVTLLQEARSAGLAVVANGDRLVIRGPRSAAAIASRLLALKPDVMLALTLSDNLAVKSQLGDTVFDFDSLSEPSDPCQKCGSLETWYEFTGKPHCQHCEADQLQRCLDLVRRASQLRTKGSTRRCPTAR
jgi:hypothetical protein